MSQCCVFIIGHAVVRIANEQNNTAQWDLQKVQNMQKTIKLTENANQKAIAIHWREASGKQQHWLIHWGWLKSDQTCKQANMLAAFPLTTDRYKHWWSHGHSLGSPDRSVTFLARQLKKGHWTYHTHQWFHLQLVESNNYHGGQSSYGYWSNFEFETLVWFRSQPLNLSCKLRAICCAGLFWMHTNPSIATLDTVTASQFNNKRAVKIGCEWNVTLQWLQQFFSQY